MSIEKLPPEVLHEIYGLCCTDSGTTGLSLSLVSRYINETSRPYRIISVALVGVSQAAAFASYVQALSPDARRTHYLLISDGGRRTSDWRAQWTHFFDTATTTPFPPGRDINDLMRRPSGGARGSSSSAARPLRPQKRLVDYLDEQDISKRESLMEHHKNEQLAMHNTILAILEALSSTLKVLTLFTSTSFMPGCKLPVLESFTVRQLPEKEASHLKLFHVPFFPCLKHLHITRYRHGSASFSTLASLAPRLERLRLSGVGQDLNLPTKISCALGIQSPLIRILPRPEDNVLTDLKLLLVQPIPDRDESAVLNPSESLHNRMLHGLRDVQAADGRGCFHLLEAASASEGYDNESARKDWEGWINGGPGCWLIHTTNGQSD
jgi:hypothetical protein